MPKSSNDEASRREAVPHRPLQINLDNSLVEWNPNARPSGRAPSTTVARDRRKIRAHASRSSAMQRKATIASRTEQQHGVQQIQTPPLTPDEDGSETLKQARRLHAALNQCRIGPANLPAPEHVDFQKFVSVVDDLQTRRNWLERALQETSLAQTSIRGDIRSAMVISPALFQATLFVSGTFSNTCGLSYAHVRLGMGMAFMRGASLEAVRGAITAAEGEHWVILAIALLAGWEMRFGDKESYDIHMGAYRQIFGSPVGLEENSIATMRDFAFETLREQLNDLTIRAPLRSSKPSDYWNIPTGFDVFSPALAPEVKSLLCIVRDTRLFDPRPSESLPHIRNLGLKAMCWTPHHGESVEPSETFEGHWDAAELNALLHVRAAVLSIVALHSHVCHTTHGATTYLDIMGAADVHAYSCGHLRTDALMVTKYQNAVVWARVAIAAVSRDPSRDKQLEGWLAALDISTWEALQELMEAHVLHEHFLPQTRNLFHAIQVKAVSV